MLSVINFSNKIDAESYAKSLGGTLATVDQLTKAHDSQGMDICWVVGLVTVKYIQLPIQVTVMEADVSIFIIRSV
jgi:hypothetical protein